MGTKLPRKGAQQPPHFSTHFALALSPILATVKLDHRTHFRAILTLNGSNEVFMQPLMPFGGIRDKLLRLWALGTLIPIWGSAPPKPPKRGVNRHFQVKLTKY